MSDERITEAEIAELERLLEAKRTAGIPGTPRETFLYVARDNLRDWLEEHAERLLSERREREGKLAEYDRTMRDYQIEGDQSVHDIVGRVLVSVLREKRRTEAAEATITSMEENARQVGNVLARIISERDVAEATIARVQNQLDEHEECLLPNGDVTNCSILTDLREALTTPTVSSDRPRDTLGAQVRELMDPGPPSCDCSAIPRTEGLTINNNPTILFPCAPTPSPHCRTPNVSGTLSSPCWIGFQARFGNGWRHGSPRSSDRCANGKEPNVLNDNLRDEMADLRLILTIQIQRLDKIDEWLKDHVVMRRRNGNMPSPAKPRPHIRFETEEETRGWEKQPIVYDSTPLPPERERQDREATRPLRERLRRKLPEEMMYFSLEELIDVLLKEEAGANSSPAPAADRTGPRSPRRATPARKVTSSKSTKRARSGKGGK